MPVREPWAADAVVYQIYPRSFADSDGDGVGDLAGITGKLDYLTALGVDALWLSPFYPSPMADGGYDVADYRGVDPVFGTLADFDTLLAEAHRRGLKLMIDIVPNHTSDQHPWFREALAAGPDSPARERYIFRKGDGDAPPNDWPSAFGGPAWTRVSDGYWYLHLFAREQPDLNWDHPQVRAEFLDILRFWLDRGVDGLRIDVADALVKPPDLTSDQGSRDLDGVHEIYRQWRQVLDAYTPQRIAVAEAWEPGPQRLARYVRPDELHQAFNFQFLSTPWAAAAYRQVIQESLTTMRAVGAATTWVLSNHDVVRHTSRFGWPREFTGGRAGGAEPHEIPVDGAAGLARARAATLMMLALPGSAYLYQGEELGLPEVFDLPDEARQDPRFHRTNGQALGRDGCRVPLPWSGTAPPFGFGPDGTRPWLPQPAQWSGLTAAAQRRDPASTWSMYRDALALRRRMRLGQGELAWLEAAGPELVAFSRTSPGGTLLCATNCGDRPVRLPAGFGAPLLTSGRSPAGGLLPPDTTVWAPPAQRPSI